MARYADLGHEVVALYLTRGEAGVAGKNAKEAAEIRTAEAQAACKILKARAVFMEQADGASEVSAARYGEMDKVFSAERPDLVLVHWPLDTHADHRACFSLVYGAWVKAMKAATAARQQAGTPAPQAGFALYFYEVDTGSDTQSFKPTDYVDVTATEARKRAACMAHASQGPDGGFYTKDHEPMMRFRGMEAGCKAAEAFVRQDRSGMLGR